jgi:hypothetical protein
VVVPRGGVPQASNNNVLRWQTYSRVAFDPQRHFSAVANPPTSERTKCDRKGRYGVAWLIEKYGRKGNMMKWRDPRISDVISGDKFIHQPIVHLIRGGLCG